MFVPVCDRPSVAEPTGAQGRTVMESKRALQFTEKCRASRIANSPLLDLPIRQVMGDAHYLPQPALPEVPGRGGARLARRARGRTAAGAATSMSCSRCRRRSPTSPIQNKAVIYDLLFKAAAETLLTIAADPKHLGAAHRRHRRAPHLGLGADASSACPLIVPGGGISLDGSAGSRAGPASSCRCACSRGCSAGCSWRGCRALMRPGAWASSATQARLAEPAAFAAYLAPLRRIDWVVYCQAPVRRARGGARLSVALHPSRRHLQPPADRLRCGWGHASAGRTTATRDAAPKVMTLSGTSSSAASCCTCCPTASTASAIMACSPMARAGEPRSRTDAPGRGREADGRCSCNDASIEPSRCCPCCGGRMILIERFARACAPRPAPSHPIRMTPHDLTRAAHDLHAADDGCRIRGTGARCVALCGDPDASSSMPLVLRGCRLPRPRWPSQRTHPHRFWSLVLARHPMPTPQSP